MFNDDEAYSVRAAAVAQWWWKAGGREWSIRLNFPTYDIIAFSHFIQDPYDKVRHYIVNIDNPRVRRIVRLLEGPYRDIIVKMLELQYEQKSKRDNHSPDE